VIAKEWIQRETAMDAGKQSNEKRDNHATGNAWTGQHVRQHAPLAF
jgi:hypothetical protein